MAGAVVDPKMFHSFLPNLSDQLGISWPWLTNLFWSWMCSRTSGADVALRSSNDSAGLWNASLIAPEIC